MPYNRCPSETVNRAYVSHWSEETKQPKSPALTLLYVIRRRRVRWFSKPARTPYRVDLRPELVSNRFAVGRFS